MRQRGTVGLQGYQRKFLRGLAHELRPVVQIGESGVSAGVARALDAALGDHELVKVRLREPKDKKAMAQQLADVSRAELCGLVGHTVILYRRNPKSPKIKLPVR